jgi:hypothetical protein
MFHIKRKKSQIIYYEKYSNSKNPQVCIPKTEIKSLHNEYNFKKMKKMILNIILNQMKTYINQDMLLHVLNKFKMFQ